MGDEPVGTGRVAIGQGQASQDQQGTGIGWVVAESRGEFFRGGRGVIVVAFQPLVVEGRGLAGVPDQGLAGCGCVAAIKRTDLDAGQAHRGDTPGQEAQGQHQQGLPDALGRGGGGGRRHGSE